MNSLDDLTFVGDVVGFLDGVAVGTFVGLSVVGAAA